MTTVTTKDGTQIYYKVSSGNEYTGSIKKYAGPDSNPPVVPVLGWMNTGLFSG
jgi:hypothetical protein